MRTLISIVIVALSLFVGCSNQTIQSITQPTAIIVSTPTVPTIDLEAQALATCKQAVVNKFNIWTVVFLDSNHTILQPEPHVRVIRSTVLVMLRMNAKTVQTETWTWLCSVHNETGQWIATDVLIETYRK
ncbi:hypothetical protein [Herpetosiphon gulosus]|uniref:SH3 domain-containing protein n=1 Tax=Herpetosiphon gulosus TaxID=1973496 RepID=A0ABP9WZ02_9CHLR